MSCVQRIVRSGLPAMIALVAGAAVLTGCDHGYGSISIGEPGYYDYYE